MCTLIQQLVIPIKKEKIHLKLEKLLIGFNSTPEKSRRANIKTIIYICINIITYVELLSLKCLLRESENNIQKIYLSFIIISLKLVCVSLDSLLLYILLNSRNRLFQPLLIQPKKKNKIYPISPAIFKGQNGKMLTPHFLFYLFNQYH